MKDLKNIITKYNYSVTQAENQIYITQDGTSGFFGFLFIVGGGVLGWYMGKQDPALKEIENDPFIADTLFYKILDFIIAIIQWGFIIGGVLISIFMFYNLFEKISYQLIIGKDSFKLNSLSGAIDWKWTDIEGFSIENSTESLFAKHASGEKKKLLEFYSKDKSAIKDLKEVKNILLSYRDSLIDVTE